MEAFSRQAKFNLLAAGKLANILKKVDQNFHTFGECEHTTLFITFRKFFANNVLPWQNLVLSEAKHTFFQESREIPNVNLTLSSQGEVFVHDGVDKTDTLDFT